MLIPSDDDSCLEKCPAALFSWPTEDFGATKNRAKQKLATGKDENKFGSWMSQAWRL